MVEDCGNFVCDYCGGVDGGYFAETGNHVLCQELADLKEKLQAAEQEIEQLKAASEHQRAERTEAARRRALGLEELK